MHERHKITRRVRLELARRYPKCFLPPGEGPKRPLKLGIHEDLKRALPRMPVEHLLWALRDYVCGSSYLRECVQGVARVDLDGRPAGMVTQQHAGFAQAILQTTQVRRQAANKLHRRQSVRQVRSRPREAAHGSP